MPGLDPNTEGEEIGLQERGGEQGNANEGYDGDNTAETSLTNDGNTEGGESLGSGGVESPVSGPSQDTVTEQVREAATEHQAFEGEGLVSQNTYHTDKMALAEFIREKFGEVVLYLDEKDGLSYKNFEHYIEEGRSGNISYRPEGKKGRYKTLLWSSLGTETRKDSSTAKQSPRSGS